MCGVALAKKAVAERQRPAGYRDQSEVQRSLQRGIDGGVVGLYYETYEESVENAVIPVTVYVLDDETAARYKEQNDAILEADTVVGR